MDEQFRIFKPEELSDLQPGTTELQKKSQLIKQRFDYRRNAYHTYRNNITEFDTWAELNDKLNQFDQTQFNVWSQKWATIQRTNNLNQIINFFEEGNKLFKPLEESFTNIRPSFIGTEEIERIQTDILTKVEQDILNLKTDVLTEVNKGIKNVLDLKAELGLFQNFSENINAELKSNDIRKNWFLFAFILSLCFIAIGLITTFFYDSIKNWDLSNRIAIKLTISIPMGFLSYFFFCQYKLHQIITLKLSHLNGFLGGGASYLGQLTDQDPETKRETNKNLAQMFINLDDIMTNVKNQKHPTEITFDSISKEIKTLTGSVNEIIKNVNELKKK